MTRPPVRAALTSPCSESTSARPFTSCSSTRPCRATSERSPPTPSATTSPWRDWMRAPPATRATRTLSKEPVTSAEAASATSTRPCSLRTVTAVAGGTVSSKCVSKPTSRPSERFSISSRLVATRSTFPSSVAWRRTSCAKARACSSVGRNTTFRSAILTCPGSPARTSTPPKALTTSMAVPAGTGWICSASKVYEGPKNLPARTRQPCGPKPMFWRTPQAVSTTPPKPRTRMSRPILLAFT